MEEGLPEFLLLVPGLSRALAHRLARRFETRVALGAATIEDLLLVEGMSPDLARRVLDAVAFDGPTKKDAGLYICPNCGSFVSVATDRCPHCGTEESTDLVRLGPEERDQGYTIVACRRCKAYLKELDRRVRWNARSALVEDWGSPHFDVAARRAGYWRACPTLLLLV